MDLVQSVGAASRLAKFVCPGSGQFEYEKCSDLYYVCSGGNYVIAVRICCNIPALAKSFE